MFNLLTQISRILALPINGPLWLYQKTVSPDHGALRALYPEGYCRYYPSCSQYAREGLKKDGIIALPKVLYRVVRCQPWSLGGIDYYQNYAEK